MPRWPTCADCSACCAPTSPTGRASPSGLLPALRPQPAVDEVSDLVDQVRASGLEVSMVRMGTPRTLPPGTGVAVFRICQESLTNVLKHAGPAAHATVLLQWGATSLVLEVNDDGRGAGAADDGAGQGTIGMRERAAMLGGMLTLGPRPGRWLPGPRRDPDPTGTRTAPRSTRPRTGGPMTIRVALVDDQQLVRAGFRMVIDSQPDLEVVLEAGDGEEAVRRLSMVAADVVLMDVRMPRMDGLEATAQITSHAGPGGHEPRVVVLTTFDLDEYVLRAIRAGASGFLLKDAPPEELLTAIRTVSAGDAVIAPSSTRRLLEHLVDVLPAETQAHPGLADLTDREREVLVLMARGRSNQEVASDLVVAEATVKTHVGRVLAKLGARDRVQAVVVAYESGLVRPGA